MFRLSLVLVFGLSLMSSSLATPIESGTELIDSAIKGRVLYDRYLQWKSDQPADGDTSFATFYDSIKDEKTEKQREQREVDEVESRDTIQLGHDNGELEALYDEWKKIQPEGRPVSFENYLEWLQEQRTVRELGADVSDAEKRDGIQKRFCSIGCSCCPFHCGIRC